MESVGVLSADGDLLKVEDLSIFGSTDLHPIIFEECYVKDNDIRFINLVKSNPDILTEEALLRFDSSML